MGMFPGNVTIFTPSFGDKGKGVEGIPTLISFLTLGNYIERMEPPSCSDGLCFGCC